MNSVGVTFFNCFSCGRTAKFNNGGAISYYDNEGNICYPPHRNMDKTIKEIEREIEDLKK